MEYNTLFSPIKLRGLELKNRIFLPAMETKLSTPEGGMTQKLIDYHVARAKGGCGLNVTEVCAVHESSHGVNFMGLYTQEHMEDMQMLVDAVHEAGGKICVQLWHGGFVPASLLPPERKPMLTNQMTKDDIDLIVECYGKSAALAVKAGCDCLEFHAAHTYLPHTFLSAAYNQRTDEYGGSLENRARFALRCIESIRKNMPEDMPLLMRVNCQDDCVVNGLTYQDIIQFINMASEKGVDLADISRGNANTAGLKYEVPSIDIPQGYNVENVARIRREVNIPVSAVGRINTPELAEEILSSGKADMVAIGRAQIADPEFCNKAASGNANLIRTCIACNEGCFDSILDISRPHITCLRNPFVGKEGRKIKQVSDPKKVMIAGGGIAGLVAACILKKRGHEPVLYEATDRLGGQFILAGKAPTKTEMEEAAVWEGEEAKRLGVEIHMNTKVTPELIEAEAPDAVIISVGAVPSMPPIPGIDLPHVSNSHDVLDGLVTPQGKVIIIGGGLVGLEVAEYLTDKGAECTILSRNVKVGANLGMIRKLCVGENIYRLRVQSIVGAACKGITENEVIFEQDGLLKSVSCDNVVVSVGSKACNSDALQQKCKELVIPFYVIGDAMKAGLALYSTAQGAAAALNI